MNNKASDNKILQHSTNTNEPDFILTEPVHKSEPSDAFGIEKKLYERRDLFVKPSRFFESYPNHITSLNPTVYIQDSIEHQDGRKIGTFVRHINTVIDKESKILTSNDIIVPCGWQQRKNPKISITVSIKCDDTTLGPKSQKVISALQSAIKSGVKIEFFNRCKLTSPWNAVIESMKTHSK